VSWFWSRFWMYSHALKFTNAVRRRQILTIKTAFTLRRRNLKTQLYFTDWPTVRHENGAFRKRSSNRRNLKTTVSVFHFRVDGKQFENRALFENEGVTIIIRFPCPNSLKHKSKITGDSCVFKFLRRSVVGKHLMRFQSETFVFKFLRRIVDGV